ncbi:MAG TPA: undecaprenyldiphospho-muramoylpentapeptide beta-N-acetylglucosaminyltransferase, partial [Candidatus Acidoferrales bacterium]|nr:undecaprenyldiphospho-muramoylpentapeptide beta-N-acetylglucosaminyltransferase [Candidatus Acidoferrales bacterium]
GIETRLVPAAGYELKLIEVSGYKGMSIAKRLKALWAVPSSVLASLSIIRQFKPDVIIGVGGYASAPAMIASGIAGVPSLVFEPNVVPGLANRIAARFAKIAAVHFEQTGRWFRRFEVTGVPVREAFFHVAAKTDSTPTLLLFGGSQGARILNRTMCEALPLVRERVPGIHIIHQTGQREYEQVRTAYEASGLTAEVSPFIDDMPAAFARADAVLCRSGASTVAEIAAAGKAAIFVPFAAATDQHQLRNAELLAQKNAAELISEDMLTPECLVDAIASLLNDASRRHAIEQAARALAHPNAAARIADMAVEISRTR